MIQSIESAALFAKYEMASQKKDTWYRKHLELRKLINAWELIPGSPKDEFDRLNFKLLGFLQRDPDLRKLIDILESELIITYGLSPEQKDLQRMANEIEEWWINRK